MAEGSPQARERSVVRDAMVRFSVLSGVCLVIVGLVSVLFAGTLARHLASREAEARTQNFVDLYAAPMLDEPTRTEFVGSDLEEALTVRLGDESILHAAVYDQNGRVIWSAEEQAVGTTEDLGPEVEPLFQTGAAYSHYSDRIHADPQGENADTSVLEVYAGGTAMDGEPFVMEWYWPTTELANSEDTVLARLLTLSVGGLLLFQLMVLPLTLSTARRVEIERTRLTQHVVNASRLERRRLSEDLHDGVAQDLAAIGYVLPIMSREMPEGSPGQAMLSQVREMVQSNISLVRGLIADIRPLDVRGDGFREVLDGLVLRVRDRGVETTLTVSGDVGPLSVSSRALIYRVVREGLRNVVRHSGATHAWVDIERNAPHVHVTVRDNGTGLSDSLEPHASPEDTDPHFGLELLREALSDVDGTLDLRSVPEGGAELLVTFRTDRVLA